MKKKTKNNWVAFLFYFSNNKEKKETQACVIKKIETIAKKILLYLCFIFSN